MNKMAKNIQMSAGYGEEALCLSMGAYSENIKNDVNNLTLDNLAKKRVERFLTDLWAYRSLGGVAA